MANIGDDVTITISGSDMGGTSLAGTIQIGKGTSMSVHGVIKEDLGDSWLVQLDIAVDGKDHILVHKSAEKLT